VGEVNDLPKTLDPELDMNLVDYLYSCHNLNADPRVSVLGDMMSLRDYEKGCEEREIARHEEVYRDTVLGGLAFDIGGKATSHWLPLLQKGRDLATENFKSLG